MEIKQKLDKESKIFTFENVKYFIEMADRKVGAALAFLPIITGIISYAPIKSLLDNVPQKENASVYYITLAFLILTALLFLGSALFFCLTLCPNHFGKTKAKKENKQKAISEDMLSTTFYGDIANFKDKFSFANRVNDIGQDGFEEIILENTYDISKVCSMKMKTYKVGIWLTFFTIAASVITLICSLFI